jgi:DDB1- and CUL4-associated factor 13
VRDCLEVLRVGGGLDNRARYRRANLTDWHYIYQEVDNTTGSINQFRTQEPSRELVARGVTWNEPDPGLIRKKGAQVETEVFLPAPVRHQTPADSPCDKESPRLFHMFWTGPFTDKPYLALLSFLYTQNLGLHFQTYPQDSGVCRPQFWLWINPGPAASIPGPSAVRDMFEQLKNNPWASPFLHPRFKDVIQFKLWNTTEQLDAIPEIKDEWRQFEDVLFNSEGRVFSVALDKQQESKSANLTSESIGSDETGGMKLSPTGTKKNKMDDDDLFNRTGSKSSSSYDRLSVILSDLVRFVLCHRFGGIYLDADNILLRDWEEMWGWKGAYAYRWSRLPKYNTAVLHMNKGSALGTFLFRTALKNGFDFHPWTVSRYTKDAYLEGLLLRLPDALFDSAWLNTEFYQRDRPPQPYFLE